MPPSKPGQIAKTPANPGGDGLAALAEDLMRIIVNVNGGFPNHPELGREIVRQLREMYDEIKTPTQRKSKSAGATVAVDDDEEGDDYGR